MSGAETVVIEEWIEATLLASTAVTNIVGNRIYLDLAPSDAEADVPYPFIVYKNLSATDLRVVGPYRVFTDTLYAVHGTYEGNSYTPLAPLASAIDAALTTITPAVVNSPSGIMLSGVRTRPFRMPEIIDGAQLCHLGGVYQFIAQ